MWENPQFRLLFFLFKKRIHKILIRAHLHIMRHLLGLPWMFIEAEAVVLTHLYISAYEVKKACWESFWPTVADLWFSHSSLPTQLQPSCSLLFKLANTSLFMDKLDQTGSLCGCAFVLCVVLNCHERAHSWNTDALCPFSVSLCKHVLANIR